MDGVDGFRRHTHDAIWRTRPLLTRVAKRQPLCESRPSISGLDSRWQACCLAGGMNDEAYDISHLLESEPVKAEVPELRIVRAPPAAPARTVVITAQEAMAQELLKAA